MQLHNKARVLIVENDPVIRSFLSAILKNYLPQTCTFKEAFEATWDVVPHLIVMHIDLGFYSDTLKFLEKVRQTYGTECPLVLLIVPKDWFDSSFDAFIDGRMVSPIDPDEFRSNVENLLRRKLG
jgi:DNA-binding response OmpR family regulator